MKEPRESLTPTSHTLMPPRNTVVFNYYTTIHNHILTTSSNISKNHRKGVHHMIPYDPDTLTDIVSIMVNKHEYDPSLKDILDKYYEMFRGRNHTNKTGEVWKNH